MPLTCTEGQGCWLSCCLDISVNRLAVDKCSDDIAYHSTSIVSEVKVECRCAVELLAELKQLVAISSL